MIRSTARAAAFYVAVFTSQSYAIELDMPIDCTIGVNCLIQNYVDAEPDENARDFACGPLAYNGHQGTDFRLRNQAEISKGYNALAAAPGQIVSVINDRPDHDFTDYNEDPLGCGNAVMINHGGGWVSQYCHLANGSIPVTEGQNVETGDVLGKVGSSGGTSFPHLHYAIRRFGATINPFTGVSPVGCKAPKAKPLWKPETKLSYQPTALIGFGVTGQFPSLQIVQTDHELLTPPQGDTMPVYVWFHLLGARKGDSIRLMAFDSNGRPFASELFKVEQDQTIYLANIGLTPEDLDLTHWPPGKYKARAVLYTGSNEAIREVQNFNLP